MQKKIWKIFLGTVSKYFLKIGDYRRFMHKIPLTPNCTVAKPLKLPIIPFKTRKICQFRSRKCKKIWKIFLGTFSKYFLKVGQYWFFQLFVKNNHYSPIFKKYFENVPNNIFQIFLHFLDLNWHIFLVLKGIIGSFNGLATVQFGVRGILCIKRR